MDRIEIRTSKVKAVYFICVCLVFTAAGASAFKAGVWHMQILGVVCIAFGCLGCWLLGREWLAGVPRAVIDNDGIVIRGQNGVLPWSEIAGVKVRRQSRGRPLIWLQIRCPNRWQLRPTVDGERMFMENRAHGWASVAINLTGTSASVEAIEESIRRMSGSS